MSDMILESLNEQRLTASGTAVETDRQTHTHCQTLAVVEVGVCTDTLLFLSRDNEYGK